MNKSSQFTNLDYLNAFLVFQSAMVPFWKVNKVFHLLVLVFFLYQYISRYRRIAFNRVLAILLALHVGIALIQGVIWSFSPLSVVTSFFLTIYMSCLLFLLYREKLMDLLEIVFFRLIQLSLVLYFAMSFVPAVKVGLVAIIKSLSTFGADTWDRSMIVFTHWDQLDSFILNFSRYSGFAYEPGAIGALLVLFLLFGYLKGRPLTSNRSIWYLVALFFSFSSAAQLSFFFLLGGIVVSRTSRLRGVAVVILPLFILGGFYVYNTVDFFANKIENQVKAQTQTSLDVESAGRIIGYRKSFYVLSKYPLFGRGLLVASKPEDRSHPEYAEYGWPSYVASYGLVVGGGFMILFVIGLYQYIKSYRNDSWLTVALFIVALMINLTAQNLISSPIFFFFFLYGIYHKRIREARKNRALRYKANKLKASPV